MSSAVQSGEVAFRATVLLGGKTATGIRVPDEVVAALGTSRRPADFAAALAAEPDAETSFAALSYSRKRAHVESIEGAKTAATRERRIAKSVAALLEGRA